MQELQSIKLSIFLLIYSLASLKISDVIFFEFSGISGSNLTEYLLTPRISF